MTHQHEWGEVRISPLAREQYRECWRCGSTTTDPEIIGQLQPSAEADNEAGESQEVSPSAAPTAEASDGD